MQSEKSTDLNRKENLTKGNVSAKRTALFTYDSDLDEINPISATNPLPVEASVTPAPTYLIRNIAENATHKYFGFEVIGTDWRIMRKTLATSVFEYATGTSNYATNWTNRESLSYS